MAKFGERVVVAWVAKLVDPAGGPKGEPAALWSSGREKICFRPEQALKIWESKLWELVGVVGGGVNIKARVGKNGQPLELVIYPVEETFDKSKFAKIGESFDLLTADGLPPERRFVADQQRKELGGTMVGWNYTSKEIIPQKSKATR